MLPAPDCLVCCDRGAESAVSGATSIACVAFAPDGGGRKEGRLKLSLADLRKERRHTAAATTAMASVCMGLLAG